MLSTLESKYITQIKMIREFEYYYRRALPDLIRYEQRKSTRYKLIS